jgi:hypothetical protein
VLGSPRHSAPPLVPHASPLHPVEPALVTTSSVAAGLVSVAGALLLAWLALYRRWLPWLKRGHEPGTGLTMVIQRFQSGVINDYVTWLVLGLAVLGGALVLITTS